MQPTLNGKTGEPTIADVAAWLVNHKNKVTISVGTRGTGETQPLGRVVYDEAAGAMLIIPGEITAKPVFTTGRVGLLRAYEIAGLADGEFVFGSKPSEDVDYAVKLLRNGQRVAAAEYILNSLIDPSPGERVDPDTLRLTDHRTPGTCRVVFKFKQRATSV